MIVAIAFLGGIYMVSFLPMQWWAYLVVVLVATIAAKAATARIAVRRIDSASNKTKRLGPIVVAAIISFVAGGTYFALYSDVQTQNLEKVVGKGAVVVGRVADLPQDVQNGTRYVVETSSITSQAGNKFDIKTKILLTAIQNEIGSASEEASVLEAEPDNANVQAVQLQGEKESTNGKTLPRQSGQDSASSGNSRLKSVRGGASELSSRPEVGSVVVAVADISLPPPEMNTAGFSYKNYLSGIGVYLVGTTKEQITAVANQPSALDFAMAAKLYIISTTEKYLHGDEAGLMRGVLVGDRAGLSKSATVNFSKSGMSHIVAVSGLHMGIMMSFATFFIGRFTKDKRRIAIAAIVLVAAFVAVTGFSPSATRAGLMNVIFLSSFLVRRKVDSLTSISTAALIICLINPYTMFGSSFIMSFFAVLGIVLLSKPLSGITDRLPLPKAVRESVNISICVTVFLAPALAVLFSTVSLISIFANIFIVPLVAFVMMGGLALAAASAILPLVAPYIAALCYALLWIVLRLVSFFASVPYATVVVGTPTFFGLLSYYTLVAFLATLQKRSTGVQAGEQYGRDGRDAHGEQHGYGGKDGHSELHGYGGRDAQGELHGYGEQDGHGEQDCAKTEAHTNMRQISAIIIWKAWAERLKIGSTSRALAVVLAASVIINIFLWADEAQYNKVTFINVGQGDSALIFTSDGKNILIDTGGSGEQSNFDVGEQVLVPYLKSRGVNRIDLLILSHYHADHSQGTLALLDAVSVGKILSPEPLDDNALAKEILRKAEQENVEVSYIKTTANVELSQRASVEIVNSNEVDKKGKGENANCLVARVTSDNEAFLFTGDVGAPLEQALVRGQYANIAKADVLKAAHHGSKFSTSSEFLVAAHPRYSVVSVGHNNYGQPSASALSRLADGGAAVYRTDVNGDVTFRTTTAGLREIVMLR